jgi:hypothetical protein
MAAKCPSWWVSLLFKIFIAILGGSIFVAECNTRQRYYFAECNTRQKSLLPCLSSSLRPPPDACLVAVSSSFFVVRGLLRPKLCTRGLAHGPQDESMITSTSTRLVSSLLCREKRQM